MASMPDGVEAIRRHGARPVCLVTGATGAIGPAVVERLARTCEVRTFSRRLPDERMFNAQVTAIAGEVTDVQAVRAAARGAATIVHLAALLHILDPPAATQAEYERVNVAGTAAVLAAARAEEISRVVVMSTISVYRPAAGMLLDEASPTAPITQYGQTKLAAERMALEARRRDGAPLVTVLRSAAVYGPRVKGNYARLIRALASRRFIPIGPGHNRRTLVFERDLAAAAVLAATHPDAGGRVYNVSDGTPHPLREIIESICAALGRKPPRWRLPLLPVRAACRVASLVAPALPHLLETYLEDIAVDASRIRRQLGFAPEIGLAEGWAETIDAMRRSGRL